MSIGVFDSGLGGLTVVRAIRQLLPQESIVYFGDTAHLPYGDKSAATIRARVSSICQVLLQQSCSVIVVACNSAAAAAYDHVQTYVGDGVHVVNVIDPVVHRLGIHFHGQTVGLIGTQQTVQSGIYDRKVAALQQGIQLRALATPLLAPMVEAGYVCVDVLHHYLQDAVLQDISALVLGCTHYPLIRSQIAAFYPRPMDVLDATHTTAVALKDLLAAEGLLSTTRAHADRFLVSGLTPAFEKAAQTFLGETVRLELLSA